MTGGDCLGNRLEKSDYFAILNNETEIIHFNFKIHTKYTKSGNIKGSTRGLSKLPVRS